ncbi:multisubunit sodium/proton antiporter, MrpD subunit [Archaeoglobus sulfaticallidus PM70-1]|uniref:Multisubunit sodium/proton antiporter, MrpD subunit n=1 Tax=Archaeoglobus sulfaticallidus PM70-1 TaxID=387631 RepID=N0BFH1_9EURY|nr:monovalent cation/H+ antiporter subunit D family protein [Archaeoglobus sulfaticallidus]AGK61778.1 multisubunit sodium/proton antiporter, MrpD subunit [Archaeoglobus sulfaticallidus PM70-1]
MEIISIKPLLAILVSMVASLLIILSDKKPNLREFWSVIAGIIKFSIVISMAPAILHGDAIVLKISEIIPGFVELKLKVDAFGMFFATTASLLWILNTLYSIGYMRSLREHSQTRYFACFAIALSATMGICFAGNLITLYLFYEILTVSTYLLVVHEESVEAFFAGWKYFVYLLGASVMQLSAIVLTYVYTGTTDFSYGGVFGNIKPEIAILLLIFFIAGYTKAAVMPFHSWLPTAMIAPTPVSALLHAVAVVKAGVFSILRGVFFIIGYQNLSADISVLFAYFVSITIIVASLFALSQDNLKLRLAYSTVSQLSYIILGALLLTPSGMIGGIFHIASHAFGKITLFFCAGSIYVSSGLKNISEMSGIGRKMPITMISFAIATLTMIGLPPGAGFISKWYLALGTIEMHQIPLLIVLLVSSILNAGYFLPVVYKAFFEDNPKISGISESSPFVYIPLLITSIASVAIFFYPDYFLSLAKLTLGV